jgi:hypothetical protein
LVAPVVQILPITFHSGSKSGSSSAASFMFLAKLKRLLQPPLCSVQIAQLALVTAEVVSHRRADGEFVHDAQQVVAGHIKLMSL